MLSPHRPYPSPHGGNPLLYPPESLSSIPVGGGEDGPGQRRVRGTDINRAPIQPRSVQRACREPYYFPLDRVHYTWDVAHPPVLTVDSGDTVVVQTREVADNQITPTSTAADIGKVDWQRVYPLAGPIAVKGAAPGMRSGSRSWTSTLRVGVGQPSSRARPAARRLQGSLPSHLRSLGGDVTFLRDDIAIPIEPFFGTMGVCPAGASKQAIMPPGTFGGNLDTRQLVPGDDAILAGGGSSANFCCGDAHAAQGDGEVCVTGIESPIYAALRFTLHKSRRIPAPQYQTAGPDSARRGGGWFATTGVGPDLFKGAQDALRAMLDHLTKHIDSRARTRMCWRVSSSTSRSLRSSMPDSTS